MSTDTTAAPTIFTDATIQNLKSALGNGPNTKVITKDFTADMSDKEHIAKCMYDTIINTEDPRYIALQIIDRVEGDVHVFSNMVVGHMDVADLYDLYMQEELGKR